MICMVVMNSLWLSGMRSFYPCCARPFSTAGEDDALIAARVEARSAAPVAALVAPTD